MRFSTYELLQLQLQLQSDVASVFHSANTVEGGFEQLGDSNTETCEYSYSLTVMYYTLINL